MTNQERDWTDLLDYDDAEEVLNYSQTTKGADDVYPNDLDFNDNKRRCRLCQSELKTSSERFFDTCEECMKKQQEKIDKQETGEPEGYPDSFASSQEEETE